MLNDIQNITEDVQRAKIILKYIYKVFDHVNDAKQMEKLSKDISKQLNKNDELLTKEDSINPSVEVSVAKEPISEKEFNYKMAAHDLISPLATQFTLLDILREDVLQVLERIDSLTISNSESIKRSKAVLNSDTQINQPIPFEQLIEVIIQLLSIRELCKHVDIVVHHNTKKSFYNNIAMVQSIMQNLIQNAVKYSKLNQKNTITITVNDTSNGVEIIVQDTGIGMDKERVSKLFKQVVDEHKGVSHSHGFGLYGVAQYVEKLNGKITAASTLNVGSTFRVSLPSLVNS